MCVETPYLNHIVGFLQLNPTYQFYAAEHTNLRSAAYKYFLSVLCVSVVNDCHWIPACAGMTKINEGIKQCALKPNI